MISLKKILYEVLINFSVEADIFIDYQYNTYDILNEIRALRRITIVSIITPDDYTQSAGDEYIRLKMKFVTRGNSEEALILQLREDLDQTTTLSQNERGAAESAAQQDELQTNNPYQIYIH